MPEPRAVAHHGDFVHDGHGDVQPGIFTQNEGGLQHFTQQGAEGNEFAMQVKAPLIRTGQREQRIDEVGHARGLLQRLLKRDHLFGAERGGTHRTLDVGAEHGQRGLEFVRGVRRETAEGAERRLESPDHGIESEHEPSQLIAARLDAEPSVQRSAVGDRFDFRGDPVNGPNRAPRQDVRASHR